MQVKMVLEKQLRVLHPFHKQRERERERERLGLAISEEHTSEHQSQR